MKKLFVVLILVPLVSLGQIDLEQYDSTYSLRTIMSSRFNLILIFVSRFFSHGIDIFIWVNFLQ